MFLTVTELADGIKKISLQGQMDIEGTKEIDTLFTVATASKSPQIIVDLSGVNYMGSIGISVMVRAVNVLKQTQGKIVIMNPQPNVLRAPESTRINKVIPIVYDLESARTQLKS
jgi:anti-sigma B factor antagonist